MPKSFSDMTQQEAADYLNSYYASNPLSVDSYTPAGHNAEGEEVGDSMSVSGHGPEGFSPTAMSGTGVQLTGPGDYGGRYGEYVGSIDPATGSLDANSVRFVPVDRGHGLANSSAFNTVMDYAPLIAGAAMMAFGAPVGSAMLDAGGAGFYGLDAAAGLGTGELAASGAGLSALSEVGMPVVDSAATGAGATGLDFGSAYDGLNSFSEFPTDLSTEFNPDLTPPDAPPEGPPTTLETPTTPDAPPEGPANEPVTNQPPNTPQVDNPGSDWSSGTPTGPTGGLLPITATGLTAANAAAGTGTATGLSSLTTGSAIADRVLGTAASTVLADALRSGMSTTGAGSSANPYGSAAGLHQIPILSPYHSALQGVFKAAGGGMVPDAQNLSDQGRGQDSMLVHMTPNEVAGLQSLAQAHGTSLTTNPHTGLPEAGVLSDLLPALIGGGVSSAFDLSPGMTAALVGGGYGLATGSLQKGLMAGLGAYGGAGLGSALEKVGGSALAGMDTQGLQDIIDKKSAEGLAMDQRTAATEAGIEPPPIQEFKAPERSGTESASKLDKIIAGVRSLDSEKGLKDLKAAAGDKNEIWKYGLAALGPAAMGYMNQQSAKQNAAMPAFSQFPHGRMPIYNFNMNPYSGGRDANGRYFNPTLGYTGQYYADGGSVGYGGGGIGGGASDATVDPYSGAEVYAAGGMPQQPEVSGLLKGPGDGVSDSIPAQLDTGEPARLATGEFVVPARIVSELGNGDTEAGAKKLYAMMDRIQAARARTTGDNVALNSNADKALPA